MPTVYCYPVKLTIADLIRAKSICSQTQFSHIAIQPIIDLACSERFLSAFVRADKLRN